MQEGSFPDAPSCFKWKRFEILCVRILRLRDFTKTVQTAWVKSTFNIRADSPDFQHYFCVILFRLSYYRLRKIAFPFESRPHRMQKRYKRGFRFHAMTRPCIQGLLWGSLDQCFKNAAFQPRDKGCFTLFLLIRKADVRVVKEVLSGYTDPLIAFAKSCIKQLCVWNEGLYPDKCTILNEMFSQCFSLLASPMIIPPARSESNRFILLYLI